MQCIIESEIRQRVGFARNGPPLAVIPYRLRAIEGPRLGITSHMRSLCPLVIGGIFIPHTWHGTFHGGPTTNDYVEAVAALSNSMPDGFPAGSLDQLLERK